VSAHDVSKSGDIGGVNGGVSPSPKYIWGSTRGEGEYDVIETSSMTGWGVALESIVMVCDWCLVATSADDVGCSAKC
jgi:hypothetical protein